MTNQYGDDEARVAVASARCTPCPTNMYTADKWGDAAPPNGYTNESACLVLGGWGTTETSVEICQVGFYNEGKNRLPCQPCANGYTTLGTNSTNATTDCVIKAGWFFDADKSLPAPCNKGSYSTGGTAAVPSPTSCTACATGYTTQEQESEEAADCAGEHQGWLAGCRLLCTVGVCIPCPAAIGRMIVVAVMTEMPRGRV